jgi:hypothetical protein
MARYFSCTGEAASTDASMRSCPFEAESIKPRYAPTTNFFKLSSYLAHSGGPVAIDFFFMIDKSTCVMVKWQCLQVSWVDEDMKDSG